MREKRLLALFAAIALGFAGCDLDPDRFDGTTWEAAVEGTLLPSVHLLVFHGGSFTYTITTGPLSPTSSGIYMTDGDTATLSFDNGGTRNARLGGEKLFLYGDGTAAIVFSQK